jgi:calcineurin-like phosphoesterase family protein
LRWFVSDPHFMHENILKFCRSSYASVDVMNSDMVSIWNSFVKPEDTVYDLGDLAFKTGLRKDDINALLKTLNGTHILIKGNHDERKKIAYFSAIKELHDSLIIEIGGVEFLLSHFPYKENMAQKDIVERPECFTNGRLDKDGKRMPLLHGHTHELFTIRPGGLCLCWDRWKRPVSEDEVLAIFKDTNGFTENLDKYNDLHGGVK